MPCSFALSLQCVCGGGGEGLPVGCFRSAGLIAGICWTKSQSPRYSQGVGSVVTNDWCITGPGLGSQIVIFL